MPKRVKLLVKGHGVEALLAVMVPVEGGGAALLRPPLLSLPRERVRSAVNEPAGLLMMKTYVRFG